MISNNILEKIAMFHSQLYRSRPFFNIIVWLGFYEVSTIIQLFNGDSSQIYVSWTIFNQYLTIPLPWHWRASRSAIPIVLSAKRESHYLPVLKT